METEILDSSETKAIVAVLEQQSLPKSRADQIEAIFTPMVAKLREFDTPFNEIVSEPITKDVTVKAKRLRLDIAKVRIEAEKQRKEAKEESLRVGKAIDGAYNILKFATQEKEDALEKIEKHFELMEAARVAELQNERSSALLAFDVVNIPSSLGEMSDDVWQNFLDGTRMNYEARKEAERKAEEARIAEQKAEEERREHIRLENEKLKAEAAEREKIEAARRAKEAKERAELEAKLESERKQAADKLEAERVAREKIEAELTAKNKAEEEATLAEEASIKAEEEAKELEARRAAAAPDSEKLIEFSNTLLAIQAPNVSSKEARTVVDEIMAVIMRAALHAEKKAGELASL